MKMKEVNGVKVMSSCVPEDRMPYEKWFRKMKISASSYYQNPEAKMKADEIMERVGKNINPKSQFGRFFDVITGA
jgi:hypothetical protein